MTSVEFGYITGTDTYRWKDDDDEIPVGINGRIRYINPTNPTSAQVAEILAYAKANHFGVAVKETTEPIVKIPFPQPEPTIPGTIVENENGDKYIRTDKDANNAWVRFNNMTNSTLDSIYFVNWYSVGTVVKINLPTGKA
jgi:hypothetical protein